MVLLYSLIVFTYLYFRLQRDVLIVQMIGQEGTSPAKVISLFILPLFLFFQQFLVNKLGQKTSWGVIMGFFILLLGGIHLNLVPALHLQTNGFGKIFIELINNLPVLSVYILSEMFATMISKHFWAMANRSLKGKGYNQIFALSQTGIISAALLNIVMPPSLIPIILGCAASIPLVLNLPDIPITTKKERKIEDWSLWLIPVLTILCGTCAGLIDAYTKHVASFQFGKENYKNILSGIWIIQSILCIIANFVFYNNKFFLTPLYIFITSLFTLAIGAKYRFIGMLMLYLGFKVLKYSSYSPIKERYISKSSHMDEILALEGFVSRVGKNGTAMFLSLLFSIGFKWVDLGNYVMLIVVIISFIWFTISKRIKLNS